MVQKDYESTKCNQISNLSKLRSKKVDSIAAPGLRNVYVYERERQRERGPGGGGQLVLLLLLIMETDLKPGGA